MTGSDEIGRKQRLDTDDANIDIRPGEGQDASTDPDFRRCRTGKSLMTLYSTKISVPCRPLNGLQSSYGHMDMGSPWYLVSFHYDLAICQTVKTQCARKQRIS